MIWLLLLSVFLGTALLSGVGVLASIKASVRWDVMDRPDMERKKQATPIPRLGGVAVTASVVVAIIATYVLSGQSDLLREPLALLVPAMGAAALGFVDDRRHLDPYLRLFCQALLAVAAWSFGARVFWTGYPVIDFALFVLWVVAVVNAINMIDNSDGLAGTSVLFAAAGAAAVAAIFDEELIAVAAASVCGAAIGFLVHNWFPARVYLGDAGAYFLGFLLSVLVVQVSGDSAPQWSGIAMAVLLLALPLADMVYVVSRRLLTGVHPFTAGRDHLCHHLQAGGVSVPRAVFRLQGLQVAGVLGALGLAILVS